MQKEFLDELVIESINKKLNGKEGIIFFISTENYNKYLEFLLASLRINAPDWIYLSIKIGNFQTYEKKDINLIKYQIDLPNNFDTKIKKRLFPLIYVYQSLMN